MNGGPSTEDLLRNLQPFQSSVATKYFAIDSNGITEWGKYVQALRELRAYTNSLDSIIRKSDERGIGIRVKEDGSYDTEFTDREFVVAFKDTMRLRNIAYEEAMRYHEKFDGISQQERDQLDLEFQVARIARTAKIKKLSETWEIPGSVVESIISLPKEYQMKAIEACRSDEDIEHLLPVKNIQEIAE